MKDIKQIVADNLISLRKKKWIHSKRTCSNVKLFRQHRFKMGTRWNHTKHWNPWTNRKNLQRSTWIFNKRKHRKKCWNRWKILQNEKIDDRAFVRINGVACSRYHIFLFWIIHKQKSLDIVCLGNASILFGFDVFQQLYQHQNLFIYFCNHLHLDNPCSFLSSIFKLQPLAIVFDWSSCTNGIVCFHLHQTK